MLTDLAPLSSFRRGTAVLSSAQASTIPHRIEAVGGMLLDFVEACDAQNFDEAFAIIATRVCWRGNFVGEIARDVQSALVDAVADITDGNFRDAKSNAEYAIRWIERGELELRGDKTAR
jgi:hypothetical protein